MTWSEWVSGKRPTPPDLSSLTFRHYRRARKTLDRDRLPCSDDLCEFQAAQDRGIRHEPLPHIAIGQILGSQSVMPVFKPIRSSAAQPLVGWKASMKP